MIGKPFHLGTINWSTTNAAFTDLTTIGFPSAISSLNALAAAPFDLASLYHMQGCLLIQVSGTAMHQGAIIAAVLPKGMPVNTNDRRFVHSFQCAPHGYLYANTQTALCLEIPFYSNTKLR